MTCSIWIKWYIFEYDKKWLECGYVDKKFTLLENFIYFFFLWRYGYFDIHNYETQESSNTETNNTEEDDTCDTPIVNITEGI